MTNYNTVSLLEIIEEYAEANDLISSEIELSEVFDEQIAPDVIDMYGKDDAVAISEEFSYFADALVIEGDLHIEQYNSYEYVGKYS